MLREDPSTNQSAILDFNELISEPDWTDAGTASLWREIADAKKAFSDWKGAEAAYLEILAISPTPVIKSLLAESLSAQGRFEEAARNWRLLMSGR